MHEHKQWYSGCMLPAFIFIYSAWAHAFPSFSLFIPSDSGSQCAKPWRKRCLLSQAYINVKHRSRHHGGLFTKTSDAERVEPMGWTCLVFVSSNKKVQCGDVNVKRLVNKTFSFFKSGQNHEAWDDGSKHISFQSGIGRPYFFAKSLSIIMKWKVPFMFFFAEHLQKYMVFYCLFVLTMYSATFIKRTPN